MDLSAHRLSFVAVALSIEDHVVLDMDATPVVVDVEMVLLVDMVVDNYKDKVSRNSKSDEADIQ